MGNEIIYVCNSINNKNVRQGELNILNKHEEGLYFEFGENAMNVKKRFYNDIDTLNKDFNELLKLKNKQEDKLTEREEIINKKNIVEEEQEIKKNYKKLNKKTDLF